MLPNSAPFCNVDLYCHSVICLKYSLFPKTRLFCRANPCFHSAVIVFCLKYSFVFKPRCISSKPTPPFCSNRVLFAFVLKHMPPFNSNRVLFEVYPCPETRLFCRVNLRFHSVVILFCLKYIFVPNHAVLSSKPTLAFYSIAFCLKCCSVLKPGCSVR